MELENVNENDIAGALLELENMISGDKDDKKVLQSKFSGLYGEGYIEENKKVNRVNEKRQDYAEILSLAEEVLLQVQKREELVGGTSPPNRKIQDFMVEINRIEGAASVVEII